MANKKLFIDFDCTLINAIKQVVSLYNKDFSCYKNYKPIHWTDINTYDFKELELADKRIVLDYFNDHRFFLNLEYMDCAKEVLTKLKDKYEIYVCSLGESMNLYYKEEWLKKELPFVKFIGIDINENSKASVDMSGGIHIDDHVGMLDSSNASKKIVFGDKYEWNVNWNGTRCWNWTEIEMSLMHRNNLINTSIHMNNGK